MWPATLIEESTHCLTGLDEWDSRVKSMRRAAEKRPWPARLPTVFWRGHIMNSTACGENYGNVARLQAATVLDQCLLLDARRGIAATGVLETPGSGGRAVLEGQREGGDPQGPLRAVDENVSAMAPRRGREPLRVGAERNLNSSPRVEASRSRSRLPALATDPRGCL